MPESRSFILLPFKVSAGARYRAGRVVKVAGTPNGIVLIAKAAPLHPGFLTHPISGRKVIYVNPGFTGRINELDSGESCDMFDNLFAHVLQPKYRHIHHWTVGDVLTWDHLGTWHCALADYRPDEPRLKKRCQVLADKVFGPVFIQATQAA